jgi:hypothetical protein
LSAQKATDALAAPVTFIAVVINLPAKYTGRPAHLSRKVIPDNGAIVQYISRDYQAILDASGKATFTGVAPGKYNFSFDFQPGGQYQIEYWHATTAPYDPYTTVVSPLCGGSEEFGWA